MEKNILPDGYRLFYDENEDEFFVWSDKTNKYLNWNIGTYGYKFVKVFSNRKQKDLYLHRIIAIMLIDNPNGYTDVDHIDGDRTNNNIENLRWLNRSQNSHNQRRAKGYTYDKRRNKWMAHIKKNYKHHFLGYFNTEEEARNAYLNASKEFFPDIKQ